MTRPLTEAQEQYRQAGTTGMNKGALKRAQQIASQRRVRYDRVPVACIQCGGPREPHRHPVCDDCTRKRERGL